MAGFETPAPLSQRTPAEAATTAPTAPQAVAATAPTAAATGVAPAAPHTRIGEWAARLPPRPTRGFELPAYAAAGARTQAARSEGEDNATYRGRFYHSPNSEVGGLVDIEAKQSSRSRVQEPDDDESDAEEPDEEPDDKEPDDEEGGSADP